METVAEVKSRLDHETKKNGLMVVTFTARIEHYLANYRLLQKVLEAPKNIDFQKVVDTQVSFGKLKNTIQHVACAGLDQIEPMSLARQRSYMDFLNQLLKK